MNWYKQKKKIVLGLGILAFSFYGFTFLNSKTTVSKISQESSKNKSLLSLKFKGIRMTYMFCESDSDRRENPNGECEEEQQSSLPQYPSVSSTRKTLKSFEEELTDLEGGLNKIKKLLEKTKELVDSIKKASKKRSKLD